MAKGQVPWNKGKTGVYSKATLEAMRESHLADFATEDAVTLYGEGLSLEKVADRLGCSATAVQRRLKPLGVLRGRGDANRGKRKSAETRRRMSEGRKRHLSDPANREYLMGESNPFYGRKHKPESLERMKRKVSEKLSGEGNPQWRGGVSLEPYGTGFSNNLKRDIRERDGFKCQICGIDQAELDYDLCVHHIDYDKTNHAPENLTSLCRRCHGLTTHNRDRWIAFFKGGDHDSG